MIFSEKINSIAARAEAALAPIFAHIDQVAFENTQKVMDAFRTHRVSDGMFQSTSGYGYDDRGRDVLDEVWADVMGAEAAIVRHSIVSGTHALCIGLFGILRPGDVMYSVAGKPYDTSRPTCSPTDALISTPSARDCVAKTMSRWYSCNAPRATSIARP